MTAGRAPVGVDPVARTPPALKPALLPQLWAVCPSAHRRVPIERSDATSYSLAQGRKRKISFGTKVRPMVRLLYAARRLRGSRLDLFGYHPVRRMERELVVQYRREVEALLPRLSPLTLSTRSTRR
ncbi:DUF6537 domain-containing protein [Streptomyces canus]|uniref:DUF6537 domain-containing protein n=1 Tax=Streptomyces canus TaxID=58343 RepID=UPI003250B9B9